MYIIQEQTGITSIPKNIKKIKNGRIRFESILQSAGDFNRNRRRYGKNLINESMQDDRVTDRIDNGIMFGELDHPLSENPVRATTVLFKEIAHRIVEFGWDGNVLKGILESLRTPNGQILQNLAEDGIPIGFSFRGGGDLREVLHEGHKAFEVVGPLSMITYDAVTRPSHSQALFTPLTEGAVGQINKHASSHKVALTESYMHNIKGIKEARGLIITQEGVTYEMNDFDKLVETRVISLREKFEI